MHVPDGFLDAPTSLATGVMAAAGVAVALRKARTELDDRTAPMAGLVAAFIFAGQMMNFPVGAGTSGHLLGGALAAVLVGPWTGALCISVVLIVQSLFMADGGITALGTNITLMALCGSFLGYAIFRTLRALLPQRLAMVAPAAGVAALLSVPLVAVAFTLLFAIGGTAPVEIGDVFTAMVGWHTLIGIGEGLVTGLVIAAVIASRPDLVYGGAWARRCRSARDQEGRLMKGRRFFAVALLLALLVAGFGSYYASSHPDGLEFVAGKTGFLDSAEEPKTSDSPFADYSTKGVDDERVSGGIAGIAGVLMVLVVMGGLAYAVRRRGPAGTRH